MSLFITIEGGEGGGKSTNIAFIEACLKAAGKQVVVTREPGGTEIGEALRNLLLDPKHNNMAISTELLLMFAARAQHIAEVIQPALAQGKWVVCDRFTDATYAYQGGGRKIDPQRIATLEQWVQGDLCPDLTILLDLPVELGMQRAQNRGEQDRFEQQQLEFFQRVRDCYLQMAKLYEKRYRIIDAAQDLSQVQKDIKKLLDEVLS